MNRKLLETFLWTARLGSFRAAADHLNSTQPTVSLRIRELERELGVPLFERRARASYLTPKGSELLPLAERALGLLHAMQHTAADPRTVTETVRVGVTELIAVTWLPDLVREITQRFPNVSLLLDVGLTRALARKLRAGESDLALCLGPGSEAGLKNVRLGDIKVGWFASPALRVKRRRLSAAELAQLPMISHAEDSALHEVAADWFERNGARCRRVNFCNSMHTVLILTRAGQGFSMLPEEYCRPYVANGEIRRLISDPAPRSVEYVALYPHERTSPLIAAIAEMAAQVSRAAEDSARLRNGRRP
jgi:DNA-binding transcriptional LysR family regulator